MRKQLRRSLHVSRIAFLVAASGIVFAALFFVSWLIYMPVAALIFAPVSLLAAWIASSPPSPLFNSVAAAALSGGLACATVLAVFRVLLARARAPAGVAGVDRGEPGRRMTSAVRRHAGEIAYGALVFASTALLGFVVAPVLGSASGLFPIEADARAFFSLLTLEGVPYLAGLAVLSGALAPKLAGRPLGARVALFGLNVLAAWLVGASIAFAILG